MRDERREKREEGGGSLNLLKTKKEEKAKKEREKQKGERKKSLTEPTTELLGLVFRLLVWLLGAGRTRNKVAEPAVEKEAEEHAGEGDLVVKAVHVDQSQTGAAAVGDVEKIGFGCSSRSALGQWILVKLTMMLNGSSNLVWLLGSGQRMKQIDDLGNRRSWWPAEILKLRW